MKAEDELRELIHLTNKASDFIDSLIDLSFEQESLDKLSNDLAKRDKLISHFFADSSQEDIKNIKPLMDAFLIEDKSLSNKAIYLKDCIAKEIITYKQRKKATDTYKNT